MGVNYSWFLVLFLVIFVLWDSLSETLDASDTTVYGARWWRRRASSARSCCTSSGTRSPPARGHRTVDGIDLFLFGGVMKMSRETDTPGAEFRVAVAGPLVTLCSRSSARRRRSCSAGVDSFWDAAALAARRRVAGRGRRRSLLVSMNLVLLLFNLVPAFPLDGGRIARAAAWKLTGDRTARRASPRDRDRASAGC